MLAGKQLIEFLCLASRDIDHVSATLAKKLSDEPAVLIAELTDAEAWYARMAFLLADAGAILERLRLEAMPPREEGTTELDRKAALDAACASAKATRDKIEGLCDAIKTRIMLGQSILAFQRQFREPMVKEARAGEREKW